MGGPRGVHWGSEPQSHWNITNDYKFPGKYCYTDPLEKQLDPGVQLFLEGGPYGPLRNTLMTKKNFVLSCTPPPTPPTEFSGSAHGEDCPWLAHIVLKGAKIETIF